MFSYVFMRILEARPRRYRRRLDRITGGRFRTVQEQVVGHVPTGSKVLEIGCGTGKLASMFVARGCTVDAFDSSEPMVAAAREKIKSEKLEGRLTLRLMGVDSMDSLPHQAYDVVVSTLVLSELSDDQRRFALHHAARVLKPGGRLVIADEVVPRSTPRKALQALVRLPLLAVTYLVSGSSTRPVQDLAGDVSRAGFTVEKDTRSHGDSFALIVARPLTAETAS